MELVSVNNALDIQSLLLNSTNRVDRTNNYAANQTAEYAQKGEPMYMADMDTDEDGTVTLDEFREYCKTNGINSNEMVKMSKMASFYRTMKAEEDTINYISKLIPNVSPKLKETKFEPQHLKQEDNKYNISNDQNSENKVNYKNYLEYCQSNATAQEVKTNTKYEETNDGHLKISNAGKALNSYKSSENHAVKSTFENVV